jgi:hypothetical protein
MSPGVVSEDRERERLQGVTDENRSGLVERTVASRASSAEVIVVHGRQVVMHEAIDVDQLDGGGR